MGSVALSVHSGVRRFVQLKGVYECPVSVCFYVASFLDFLFTCRMGCILYLLYCSDLDLLRDAGLTCEDASQRWKCRHCGNRINTEEVENRCVRDSCLVFSSLC